LKDSARKAMFAKNKGISVDVLRDITSVDSTNNGISSKHNSFVIIDPSIDGYIKPDSTTPQLKLVRRNLAGGEYIHAEPIEPVKKGNVGYMFGGNFIHSSDGRFPNNYPIPVHDRQDTQEDYDMLST